MSKKTKGFGNKLLASILSIVLLAGLIPQSVQAENALIDEQIISESLDEVSVSWVDTEAVTIESFLWPNNSGQYTYTYSQAEDNKKYMLLVIPGIHKSLDGMTTEDLITQLVYINQKTASEGVVVFEDFIPAFDENCSVILAGEGISAAIVGYISKDIFKLGVYTLEENSSSVIEDSITVTKNTSYEELKATLPEKGYMEVYSDYVDPIYVPVNFTWRDCESFESGRVGKVNRIIADVSVDDKYSSSDLAKITKPFVVNAIIEDSISVPCSLTATKKKAVYNLNETVSDADIMVMAHYTDGTMRTVTEWTSDAADISTASAGIQYITIKYNYESIALETKVPINVVDSNAEQTKYYQVNFETFGGSYIPAQIVAEGAKLDLQEIPVKAGFIFNGWYTDRYKNNFYNTDSVVEKNMTLYAGWRDINTNALYDIQVYLSNYLFTAGTQLTEDMITVKAVYDNGDVKEADTFVHNLDSIDQTKLGVKTLNVKYTEGNITKECDVEFNIVENNVHQLYTVTFETGCEQTISPQVVAEGETIKAPVCTLKKEGYTFSGWYADGVKWDFAKNKVTKDTVLTAKWLKKYGDNTDIYSYADEELIFEYTGKAVQPDLVIMDKNLNILSKNKDYSVKYLNNKELSTTENPAKMVVTGKGNYSGTIEIKFTIVAKDISDEALVAMKLSQYNGYKKSGYSPIPSVKYSGKALKKDKDFEISYQKLNNANDEEGTQITEKTIKDSGYYMVTVTGKGNFSGTRKLPFMIASADLKDVNKAKISFIDKKYKNIAYTGKEFNIAKYITVSIGNQTLKQGKDYQVVYPENNVDIGKKTAYIKALPSSTICFGEKAFNYNITGVAIKSAKINFINEKVDYKASLIGNNIENVTIKLNASTAEAIKAYHKNKVSAGDVYTLKKGTDYEVVYKNNEKAGKATVTLTGKGVFTGKLEKKFTINKIKLNSESVNVELRSEFVIQNKSGAKADLSVVYSTGERNIYLKEGRDYKVTYSKNKQTGSNATATVKGIGNYAGSVKVKFTIVPKALNSTDIKVAAQNPLQSQQDLGYVYKPSVVVKDKTAVLKENKDYVVDYSGCVTQKMINEGKTNGYIILKPKTNGSYNGMKVIPYQVLSNSIAGNNCTIAVSDQVYTGNPIEFNFDNASDCEAFNAEIILNNGQKMTLIPGQDFEITEYSKNVNAGTAKITISGIGDFTGTKTVSFKIVKREL